MGKKHQIHKLLSKKLRAKQGGGGRALPPRKATGAGGPPRGGPAGAGGVQKRKAKKRPVPQNKDGVSSSDDERDARGPASKSRAGRPKSLRECYKAEKSILLVGEGNFSFARALVTAFSGDGKGVTATAFDSAEEAAEKYSDVPGIVEGLQESGARVEWEVDARNLKKGLGLSKKKLGKAAAASGSWRYDVVAFNFPHAGAGIKDQDRNVRANQELLGSFFLSAVQLLAPNGEVHVTVKTGKPYDLWQVQGLAHRVTAGKLQLKTSYKFDPSDFPGYAHRRTIGFKDGMSAAENQEILTHNPRTYIWRLM